MLQLVDRAVWMGIINLLLLCAVILAQNWRQMATRQKNPLIVFVSVSLAVYTLTILDAPGLEASCRQHVSIDSDREVRNWLTGHYLNDRLLLS
ncbi:MAG: hypothetical protein ACOX20_10075, partial [Limnochordia bacterium]